MLYLILFILILVLVNIACGIIAGQIAQKKGRSFIGYFVLGLFFNFFAIIIASVASDLKKEEMLRMEIEALRAGYPFSQPTLSQPTPSSQNIKPPDTEEEMEELLSKKEKAISLFKEEQYDKALLLANQLLPFLPQDPQLTYISQNAPKIKSLYFEAELQEKKNYLHLSQKAYEKILAIFPEAKRAREKLIEVLQKRLSQEKSPSTKRELASRLHSLTGKAESSSLESSLRESIGEEKGSLQKKALKIALLSAGALIFLVAIFLFLQNFFPSLKYYKAISVVKGKAEKVYINSAGYPEAVFYNDTVMVYIPAGEFTMGTPEGEGFYNEHPQHKVYLDGFWISKNEVTFEQYDRFCEETGRRKPDDEGWGRGRRPVINVSWYDAVAYTKWLSQKTGLPFRLPTEAEWEKACRGTDGRRYPWGNHKPYYKGKWYTNYRAYNDWFMKGEDGYEYTAPIGSYPHGASPYGLLDMAGNVWEWVTDLYDENYYKHSPYKNPSGPGGGSSRVYRGGCWSNDARTIRCTSRNRWRPDERNDGLGFRPAMDAR